MTVVDFVKNLLRKKASASIAHAAEADSSEQLPKSRQMILNAANAKAAPLDLIGLWPLGRKTLTQHQRILSFLLGLALVLLLGALLLVFNDSQRDTRQLGVVSQAQLQNQRLVKAATQALSGEEKTFADMAQSEQTLTHSLSALMDGDAALRLVPLRNVQQETADKIEPLLKRIQHNVATLLAQQKTLVAAGATLEPINRQSSELLDSVYTVVNLKLKKNAATSELAAAFELAALAQRIDKQFARVLTAQGVNAQVAATLDQQLTQFGELAHNLLDGQPELRLAAAPDGPVRQSLLDLIKLKESMGLQAQVILGNLQELGAAHAAQQAILADGDTLARKLEHLQGALSSQPAFGVVSLALLALALVLAALSAAAMLRVQLLDSRQRQAGAEALRQKAQRHERNAKRINDANQAAILRLMNELQAVAEGDLTQQATVTEDITGAIADSVNYTVEELRVLVGNVQNAATKVVDTTALVDNTSTELLAASKEQLHEIRATGQSVVDMVQRINQVSTQAQESADVAQQSLQAASVGLQAVQDTIGGMNVIRDQIQETSKRIKRLGESSQEIGEITELISGITEQTNMLALNAAIQAASAGEAGRGFSVVAEEVQRLAERSADATRQIAVLVKAIQTDAQDAVGAMERSTRGVVEGAKLSDSAGTALAEIDQVSRRLAELIEQISNAAQREANMANDVAWNIQHIFAVTEQTGEGTRTTAEQVRELSRVAKELRQSVARFRIA